jgi:hypothetical protein
MVSRKRDPALGAGDRYRRDDGACRPGVDQVDQGVVELERGRTVILNAAVRPKTRS